MSLIQGKNLIKSNIRNLWQYVNVAFNRVDGYRLKEVGPDRLCAEWILKNGGSIKLLGHKNFLSSYNALPIEGTPIKLKEIDGTNATIMKIGFLHFNNCNMIDKIILNKCLYMENSALGELHYVKDTLKELHIIGCNNVQDSGLLLLKDLYNLKKLVIYDFAYVKNLESVAKELGNFLPNCDINTVKPEN